MTPHEVPVVPVESFDDLDAIIDVILPDYDEFKTIVKKLTTIHSFWVEDLSTENKQEFLASLTIISEWANQMLSESQK